MTDTMGPTGSDYERTGIPQPPDPWELMVEAKIKRLTLTVYAEGAIAVGGLALGILTFKAMTNLAKGLAQVAEITNGLAQLAYGVPQPEAPVNRPQAKMNHKGEIVIDESLDLPYEPDVSEPAAGPESEASEKTKGLIASDPIKPADIGKGEEPTR